MPRTAMQKLKRHAADNLALDTTKYRKPSEVLFSYQYYMLLENLPVEETHVEAVSVSELRQFVNV